MVIPNNNASHAGFTLIEVLIVLAIIAIMAMMAIPSLYPIKIRKQVQESVNIAEQLKSNIQIFYGLSLKFPEDNKEAGLPEPNFLIGNYTQETSLEDGALHIKFGNKINTKLNGKILTLQPISVIDSPQSPISWICGYSKIPDGMQAAGNNKTNIERLLLPIDCRH